MHRYLLAGILTIVALALVAARPTLEALQAQVDGIGGREVALAISPVDTTSFKSQIAQCPSGKVSIGGGGRITFAPGSGSVGQAIVNSYPNTESSWSVSARSPVVTANGWQLITYVVCASL